MEFTHEFTIPVPIDQAFATLTDLERIAPCMPGATLKSVDDKGHHGIVKVKVGPVEMTFQGTANLVEVDEIGRTARVHAAGRDQRGGGTASAEVSASLMPKGEATAVSVTTDITITGKAARFGRGMMAEVGGAIISQFATALAAELEGERQATAVGERAIDAEASPTESVPVGDVQRNGYRPQPVEAPALDLALVARRATVKRAAPLALLALLIVLGLRRRRSH
ncbi:MAG: SRPBCC family protein [Actinomycetota bacterium]|nr:SRPBCC family protein [Actinomycetota bacterium]